MPTPTPIGSPWPSEPVATSVGGIARGRVALEPRAELAERQQLLVGDRAGRLEHRVVQRRRVALGEDQVVVARIGRVLVVEPQVAVEQDGHQVGGRHRRGRVARAGGGAGADRVHAQLLAELAAEVGALAGHQALAPTSASRLDSRSENRSRNDFANFSTPSRSSVVDDVVVVDPGGLEVVEHLARAVDVLVEHVRTDLAVVEHRLDGLARHRVHGVGPDELLDVDHVAVLGVLGRRRRPQAALRRWRPSRPARPTARPRRPPCRSRRRAWRWRWPACP